MLMLFVNRVDRDSEMLTRLYLRAIYSPRPPRKDDMRKALRAWQALGWRLLLARVVNPTSKV